MSIFQVKYVISFFVCLVIVTIIFLCNNRVLFKHFRIGEAIDSLHGVKVYYNGSVSHIGERNMTSDGYNLGLKYQCVEFVKRYYYEHYHHKMPNAFGNAIDFFDANVVDGEVNSSRNLVQYKNPSKSKPQVGDLLVFNKTSSNQFGHVAIVSKVGRSEIEIIQQNPGQFGKSRIVVDMTYLNGVWQLQNKRILGWLRK